MRIDTGSQTSVSGVSPVSQASGAGRVQATQGSQAVQSAFQVHLTNLLSQVQPSSGEARPEKVAEISSKLAQGNYSISGNNVAEKLLLSLKA